MTQYLPPNLRALFAPRDPIPYLPPLDKLPHEKKLTPYIGVAQFLSEFEVFFFVISKEVEEKVNHKYFKELVLCTSHKNVDLDLIQVPMQN